MKTVQYLTKDNKIFTTSAKNLFLGGVFKNLQDGEKVPFKFSDLYYIFHCPEIPKNKIIRLVRKFNRFGVIEINNHLIKNIKKIFDLKVSLNDFHFLNWFALLCENISFEELEKKVKRAFFLYSEKSTREIHRDINNIYNYECFNSKVKYIVEQKYKFSNEIIKYYIDHFLDLEGNGKEIELFGHVCQKSNTEIIKYFIDKIDLECEDDEGCRPIHYVCRFSNSEMVKYIIDKGVDLECEDNQKWRPIHFICAFSTSKMIKYIIDKGVDLECKDAIWRPIHFICRYSTPEMLKYIIDKGVDLGGNVYIDNLVCYIQEFASPPIEKFFFDKGVDLKSENIDLETIISTLKNFL